MKRRGEKERRRTIEDKGIAVGLYHASPECYALLCKLIVLPSVSIIHKWLSVIDIQPGFSKSVKEALRKKVRTMSEHHRYNCSVVFDRLSYFSYGCADVKNKPSLICASSLLSGDSSFKNSASQMWCFIRNLPLVIGNKIPREKQYWELLILLRRIMDIAFAREVTESVIGHLRYHIEDHHTLFKKLFPAQNLKYSETSLPCTLSFHDRESRTSYQLLVHEI